MLKPEQAASPEASDLLRQAIEMMQRCEEHSSGDSILYCDLAEANLLVGEYGPAEGYARHATLKSILLASAGIILPQRFVT